MVKVYEGKDKLRVLDQANKENNDNEKCSVVLRFIDDEKLMLESPILNNNSYDSPFSLAAKGLFILSGDTSTDWINMYMNDKYKNVKNNDIHYSVGERLRSWNKNNSLDFVFNPQDQLEFSFDKISRGVHKGLTNIKSVCPLYNPVFDDNDNNSSDLYPTMFVFEYRKDHKLDMTVHYTETSVSSLIFDLYSLSLIHDVLCSWLNNFNVSVKKGDLVIYIDNFINEKIGITYPNMTGKQLIEPEFNLSFDDTFNFLNVYYGSLDHLIRPGTIESHELWKSIISSLQDVSPFFHETIIMMIVNHLVKKYISTCKNKNNKLENKIKYSGQVIDAVECLTTDWKIIVYIYLINLFKNDQVFIDQYGEKVDYDIKEEVSYIMN